MHLILFVVGAVLAFAGVVLLRFAVPVADMAEAALFVSAVVMLVGGVIVVALAAAVRTLNRIAERLEMQPLPLPPVAAVGREDPAPRPARTAPLAPAAAAARSSLLGWLGRTAPAGKAAAPPAAPEPAEPPVDLGPLTRVPDEPRVAPARAPPQPAVPPSPAPQPPAPPPQAPPRAAPRPPAPPEGGAGETTVYRSGVIDGMAYTLFMDGSIEAELPSGKVKFANVDDLQAFLAERR